MRALAIESSGTTLSLAVHNGSRSFHNQAPNPQGQASRHALSRVADLLAQAQLTLSQLDYVVFGQGPGAFTGLRMACALAQGLALGAGISVLPVPSLLGLAWSGHQETGHSRVMGVTDARLGQVYYAAYDFSVNPWQVVCEPAVGLPEEVPVLPGFLRVGEGESASMSTTATALMKGLDVAHVTERNALVLLKVAEQLRRQGHRVQAPGEVQPVYVRHKVALTQVEQIERRQDQSHSLKPW
jgi:tRNA threonylcarbamoyladenosine biosynthesis protein TsaB